MIAKSMTTAQKERQEFAKGFCRSFKQMMRVIEGKEKGTRAEDFLRELKKEIEEEKRSERESRRL